MPVCAMAQTKATAAEATAMVKKGVADLKAAGSDKGKIYSAVIAKDATLGRP